MVSPNKKAKIQALSKAERAPGVSGGPYGHWGGDTAGIFSGQISLPTNSLSPNTPKQETHTLGSGVLIYPQEA